MIYFPISENLNIFFDNVSVYYLCFDLLSLVAVIFTCWFCKNLGTDTEEEVDTHRDLSIQSSSQHNELSESEEKMLKWDDHDNIVSNIKKMRQKVIVNEVKSKLTQDELEKEKQTEKMQLERIFQLLQNQEDKFQVNSMDQVKDQLHLYRI